MAISKNESIVSNLSYTEKDFQSIYPSLLDLVGKETLKWNPRASNESDPGVVLLKLNALIADKCNYNIDKNVLECFPLSVTQEANARQLFEQLGYYMHWYRAANTVVSLKYIGEKDYDNGKLVPLEYMIPKFTMVSDSNNEVIYTIVEEKSLANSGTVQSFIALQGIAVDFEINGSKLITIANLDSNNRVYFADNLIAENGVFICNAGQKNYSSWEKKDNLLVEKVSSNNYFYKFGVSQDLQTCFLEFPENAEELFQDGINITYIKTVGEAGNIAPYMIDSLYGELSVQDPKDPEKTISLSNETVKIMNYVSGINGTDTETIDEAYRNYKKTIGTFDTLITLRDYQNAVKKSQYISNAIVSDRLSDPQSSYSITTENGTLSQVVHEIEQSIVYDVEGYFDGTDFWTDDKQETIIDPNEAYNYHDSYHNKNYRVINIPEEGLKYIEANGMVRPAMDAFDLKLYLLCTSELMKSATNYNTTFTLDLDEAEINAVRTEIDELKCIQHNYTDIIIGKKPCFFKCKYPINCKIIPQYNLTEAQKSDIAENIRIALYENLNAAMVDFGEELVYEDIYNIILEADSRIKAISLEPLTYRVYATYADYIEESENVKRLAEIELDISEVDKELGEDNKYHLVPDSLVNKFRNEIYAKSVLAGKTQFFVQDTEFDFGINQRYQLLERNIGRVDTNLNVTLNNANNWQYKLRDNEVVQLYAPNLIESASYSSNLRYEYYFNPTNLPVKANSYYELAAGEYIIFYRSGNEAGDGSFDYWVYGEGTIIRSSFELTSTDSVASPTDLVGNILLKDLRLVTRNNQSYLYTDGNTYAIDSSEYRLSDAIRYMTDSKNKLSGNKTIYIHLKNVLTLNDSSYYCYWVLQDKVKGKYVLFDKNTGDTRLLKSDEYFIFTDANSSDMTILGAGTQITRSNSYEELSCDAIDYSTIMDQGLLALDGKMRQLGDYRLDITEMQYVALTDGMVVRILPAPDSGITNIELNSKTTTSLKNCSISYLEDASKTEWIQIEDILLHDDDLTWKALTLLRLNLATGIPQKVYPGQSLEYYKYDKNKEKVVEESDASEYLNDNYIYKGTRDLNEAWHYEYYINNESLPIKADSEYDLKANEYLIMYKKATESNMAEYKIYGINAHLGTNTKLDDAAKTEYDLVGYELFNKRKVKEIIASTGKFEGKTDPHSQLDLYNKIMNLPTLAVGTEIVVSANGYAIWQTMKPGLIDPTKAPFAIDDGRLPEEQENVYLLAARLISDIGPRISTITYDTNDKPVPVSIYAYVNGSMDEDVQILDDGSTRVLFRNNEHKTQEKLITFKLPSGNYIMPVMHVTENKILSKLNIYLSDNMSGKAEEILYPMYVSDAQKQEEHAIDKYANLCQSGNYYLKIQGLTDIKSRDFFVTIRVEITYSEKPATAEQAPAVSIIIPPIFKYSDSDALNKDVDLNAELFVDIYETLKRLDHENLYNYTYVVNGDEEVKDPLSPIAYLDHNHVMNPYTISQWDTSDISDIYITNVTRN